MNVSDGPFTPTAYQYFYYSYLAVCGFVGLTGNAMVWILIRSNRVLSQLPSNSYLLCLAAVSSAFLLSLLYFWLDEVAWLLAQQQVMPAQSRVGCKALTFLSHLCDCLSIWLIVLVGIERLTLLLRSTRSLNQQRARLQIAVLFTAALALNGWILWVADIDPHSGVCDIRQDCEEAYRLFMTVEMIVSMIIPIIIIVFCNIIVVIKLRAHMKKMPGSPTVSFHTPDTPAPTYTSIHSNKTMRTSLTRFSSRFSVEQEVLKRKRKKGLRYTDLQLTRSLLIVTWCFVVLNLPNNVFRLATALWEVDVGSVHVEMASQLAHLLLYTHHAILFYLYIFHSPQMKRRLKPTALQLLECYCLKPTHTHSGAYE